MRTGVAALVGGIVGVLGVLCFLVAFGTDYWLLASDDCGVVGQPETTHNFTGTQSPGNGSEAVELTQEPATPSVILHHEGFFWRCLFPADPSFHVVWAVLFTNQPVQKICTHGYLFPLPVAVGPVPHPMYDATAVFRGFWTVFTVLAVVAALTGGFLLVCAVPFFSHKLYRTGGAFLITAACLFLAVVVLFLLWKELVDVRRYILQERGEGCPDAQVEVHYGWSFMVVVAGVPLVLLSGLLFLCIGKSLQRQT
ncbi:transmembrane protein 182-like [Chanos chanos]|uniref:Transmembrane protein 182-like n=1 Tax=Chanos chanos TaxID=29144 RepID=A0A6J2UTX8_CHACN|nr:transmembrane protein 182-like [Chanos chanos]